jgi:hypothetical protein
MEAQLVIEARSRQQPAIRTEQCLVRAGLVPLVELSRKLVSDDALAAQQ